MQPTAAPASRLRPAVTLLASLALAGCAERAYRPFDSEAHLRARYEERLGERAAAVAVPFALDEELTAVAAQHLSPAGSDEWQIEQINDFVFSRLGLEYALYPSRTAVGAYRARQGNCLSFVNLFVALARQQRLNPFFVEVKDYNRWDYDQGVVISYGHIVAGMYVNGKLRTFDFLPYRPKSYRDFQPIDEVKATAHYYTNLGAEALIAGDAEQARELLEIAVGLAPDFEKAVNNLGVALLRLGRTGEAIASFQRGLEQSQEDAALLSNLARAHQAAGDQEQALDILSRLEVVQHTNPFFFVYRGELALAQGESDLALEYMAKALRRDSELPEVHVGLVKVYLARGDLERARHHLERALRLDATHPDARRYAVLLAQREEATTGPAAGGRPGGR